MRFCKIILLVFFIPLLGFAQEFPEKPNPPRLVNDFTKTLSPQEVSSLENKLVAYNDSTSTQIAIVMITSLGGFAVEEYSFELAERWGIGQKGKNNGVLVFVAKEDRKIFIATGYGMEGVMPDGLVKRIVESDIKPYFKNGDYYGGLDKGTDSMFRLAAGEYKAEERKSSGKDGGPPILIIVGILFFLVMAIALKVRSVQKYAIVNNITFLAAWMLLNQAGRTHQGSWGGFSGGGGGSWGGGGGGGGFGGFGGGSFGGGGAGGSW